MKLEFNKRALAGTYLGLGYKGYWNSSKSWSALLYIQVGRIELNVRLIRLRGIDE